MVCECRIKGLRTCWNRRKERLANTHQSVSRETHLLPPLAPSASVSLVLDGVHLKDALFFSASISLSIPYLSIFFLENLHRYIKTAKKGHLIKRNKWTRMCGKGGKSGKRGQGVGGGCLCIDCLYCFPIMDVGCGRIDSHVAMVVVSVLSLSFEKEC